MEQETARPADRADGDRAPDHPLSWPFAAATLALDACFWWMDGLARAPEPREPTLAWTTPNTIALELGSMRLRSFGNGSGQPVLVCAPYALHRATVADFAPGHSVVETLQQGGLDRIHLTDWRSASPEMRYFSIDSYLGDLNVAIDEIGAPVDLVGLCQGGWLSLIYAARFPAKVRRLVLAGAPVDLSIDSALLRLVRSAPQAAFGQLVARGGGNVSGDEMLHVWSKAPSPQEVEVTLQTPLSQPGGTELLERFKRFNQETLDLPGAYYLQIVNWLFRENRLATGRFVALGREIHLSEIGTPVFLLAGLDDDVVPPAQALATAHLLGTRAALLATASEPCNHLGLFMGARTLASAWTRIAAWLGSDLTGALARTA